MKYYIVKNGGGSTIRVFLSFFFLNLNKRYFKNAAKCMHLKIFVTDNAKFKFSLEPWDLVLLVH